MGLLALGTVAGVLGGLLYLGLRRWLFVPPAWRGLAFGLVTLSTIGQPVFDPANVDFQMFEPVALVIALFAALFFVNGLILAPLLDRIHPEPPYARGARVPTAAAGIIALVSLFGLILMIDTVRSMVDDEGICYSARGGGNGCAVLERDITPPNPLTPPACHFPASPLPASRPPTSTHPAVGARPPLSPDAISQRPPPPAADICSAEPRGAESALTQANDGRRDREGDASDAYPHP